MKQQLYHTCFGRLCRKAPRVGGERGLEHFKNRTEMHKNHFQALSSDIIQDQKDEVWDTVTSSGFEPRVLQCCYD